MSQNVKQGLQERFLMNPATGSVDIESNWLAEMETWESDSDDPDLDRKRQFDSLIEVERDENGDWVEVGENDDQEAPPMSRPTF